MAKNEAKIIERTYNIPLRREYLKAPRWNRTKKAVRALRQFLVKHMKSPDVRLGVQLNQELWKHGIRNPPHHIKVLASKTKEGVVTAELFGVKKKEPSVKAKPIDSKISKTEKKPAETAVQEEQPLEANMEKKSKIAVSKKQKE